MVQKNLKRFLVLALGVYVLYGAFHPEAFALLNGANLLFHEGGHTVFGIFGEFIGILGGTLMQLLIPLSVAIYFIKTGQKYSAAVGMIWFGQNFFHIAPYIKDARSQSLPLVGGDIHDWSYILGKFHLLEMDQIISTGAWLLGIKIVVLTVILAFFIKSE